MVKIKIDSESNHFEFKVGYQVYTAMILKENGERMDKVLVYWTDEHGFRNVWYNIKTVEKFVNNGDWIVTKVLD